MSLVYLRKQAKLSQYELAKKLYVTQKAVSFWEQGKREPNCQTIMNLSNVLNCSIEDIVRCFVN